MAELSVLGIVLAGGRSARMGADKALLRHEGRSWLEHAREALEAAIRLSGSGEVRVSGERSGIPGCIPDLRPGRGPLGAVESVLEWARGRGGFTHLLLLPVDMPFVTSALLARLIREGAYAPSAHFEDRELPLLLRRTRELEESVELLLGDPADPRRCSLRALARGLSGIELPASRGEAPLLANVNTPEDWESARRLAV